MRRRYYCLIVLLAWVLSTAMAFAFEPYHYEPEVSELTGVLVEKVFYGPPGYGEDPEHDSKERVYVLELEDSIDVVAEDGHELYVTQWSVAEVQIVNPKHIELEPHVNRSVMVRGTLFSSHAGHHYTKVLMNLESISSE